MSDTCFVSTQLQLQNHSNTGEDDDEGDGGDNGDDAATLKHERRLRAKLQQHFEQFRATDLSVRPWAE